MSRVLRWLVFAVGLGCFAGLVDATTIIPAGTVGINHVAGGVQLVDGPGAGAFIGRTFANPATRGGASLVTETLSLPFSELGVPGLSGSGGLTTVVTRAVSAAEVGTAAAAVGAAFYGGCAIGTAISKYAGMGGPQNGSRVTCNVTDWLFDPGVPAQVAQCWKYDFTNGGRCFSSWEAAAQTQCLATAYQGHVQDQCHTVSWAPDGGYTRNGNTPICTGVSTAMYTCNPQTVVTTNATVGGVVISNNGQQAQCPGSIDALNPAYSVPAGTSPGPDGLCATGRYTQQSKDQAAALFGQYAGPQNTSDVLQQLMSGGQSVTTAAPRSITSVSPSSVTGQPTTTSQTGPNGTTTTTTTPQTTFVFNGDTINYSIQTTNVTNNNGSTTTTVTTTPGSQQEAQTPTDCDKYPSAIGCAQFGDPGSASPSWSSQQVNYSPLSIGPDGFCPPPTHWVVHGWSLDWNYQPACDVAPTVKAGVLALASLGALLFIVRSIK